MRENFAVSSPPHPRSAPHAAMGMHKKRVYATPTGKTNHTRRVQNLQSVAVNLFPLVPVQTETTSSNTASASTNTASASTNTNNASMHATAELLFPAASYSTPVNQETTLINLNSTPVIPCKHKTRRAGCKAKKMLDFDNM